MDEDGAMLPSNVGLFDTEGSSEGSKLGIVLLVGIELG